MDYFKDLTSTVARALEEDIGSGDLTASLVAKESQATARVVCRETAVICGRPWADEVLGQVDPALVANWLIEEGETVQADQTFLTLSGPADSLLTAERTLLNFLQTLSATATQTRRYVDAVAGTGVTLLDTRKTLPGLRLAQKYAVTFGGAENHRIGLFDAFLIKENHIEATGSITLAIKNAREINPDVRLEVEVENLEQLSEALAAKPDWIMIDNFSLADMVTAVAEADGTGIRLEASGGIDNFDDLKKIATTGVDYISIGALTKHCKAIDLSMRFE